LRSIQSALRRASSLAILGAGASALVLGLAGPVAAQSIPGPLKVTDSGPSGSPGYAIKGITSFQNDAGVFGYGTVASSAINIDGVVGYVQTPQSVGVVGWSASTGTSAYGMFGHSDTGPGVFGFNVNGAAASIYGLNNSADGTAVMGLATAGVGVYGDTQAETGVFGTTETTASGDAAGFGGVGGTDNSTACCNWGTFGVSTLSAGVGAFSFGQGNGGQALFAESPNGNDAIDAITMGGATNGISAFNDSGFDAGFFEAGSTAFTGLQAVSDASNSSVSLAEGDGTGAEVFGTSGQVLFPVLAAEEGTLGTYPFATYNFANNGVGPNDETFIISDTVNASGKAFLNASDVNISGDLYVGGGIFTDCDTYPEVSGSPDCGGLNGAVKKTSSGAKLKTYLASQSLPTMEDFGEGQLVNGQASVPLEHQFASTIDTSRSYLVFITPEGDSNGLFVASKTANGFVVRESKGGRSSLAFQYRIVAHPYGDASTRLAGISAKSRNLSTHRMMQIGNPRSTKFASVLAKNKAARQFSLAHRKIHALKSPARPTVPTVKAILSQR
jgi:hypothetical protein